MQGAILTIRFHVAKNIEACLPVIPTGLAGIDDGGEGAHIRLKLLILEIIKDLHYPVPILSLACNIDSMEGKSLKHETHLIQA